LIEVLDTLKVPGTSDTHIKKFLSTPATNWRGEIAKNQSANIDPTTVNSRITWEQAHDLFDEFCPKGDRKILQKMIDLSMELGDMIGIPYKHDLYQATIAAIVMALNKPHTLLSLPTNCGKTMVIGLMAYYITHILKKTAII
jgi:hypothetical protein